MYGARAPKKSEIRPSGVKFNIPISGVVQPRSAERFAAGRLLLP
jgi:hypothetical protein